ncbi:putative grf zinc finger domain-containing protein [Zalerion maritima]|uniref:Grf zinc finger domain-containing protein n=1 Tax=Zalerion maritima TaxID=339359 RepID=A0AAD5RNL9_9PEZI|nr:putative grf zinc finger domain-containing protein [Zalerion maritima]
MPPTSGTLDAFLNLKKRKRGTRADNEAITEDEWTHEPTDVKLGILASLHPAIDHDALLDILLAHNGSVSAASAAIKAPQVLTAKKQSNGEIGHQKSLRFFAAPAARPDGSPNSKKRTKLLSKKGATLHLFDPLDIEEHTPCSVIHNFLPVELANGLLREMLEEAKTFEKITFKLFDNVVASPHTSSFFVQNLEEVNKQKREYIYNGSQLTDVRQLTPHLAEVKPIVQEAVNNEMQRRIDTCHNGKKLKHQSAETWAPNAAFVNCYDGPQQSVGWHSDQMTYLGPRAIIGSLSLGVAREFRVRRILPKNGGGDEDDPRDPDAEGQISIHLPHNSLLVMHAEMQEAWKHAVTPAQTIDPHPISGRTRINITYRYYRDSFHPKFTPRCHCGIATVLRVVQRKKENFGRYFWMCHAGNIPDKESCYFFYWAEFDEDGNPIWDKEKYRKKERDRQKHTGPVADELRV